MDQVGQVVQVQALGRGHQFLGAHVLDEAVAHLVVDVQQHVALHLGVHQAPEELAAGGGHGFQQVGQFRRMQLVEHAPHAVQGATVQRLVQLLDAVLELLLFHALGHGAQFNPNHPAKAAFCSAG